MTGYTAGWNMPGCSPEVPFEHFDTFAEAINYLAETVDRFWDEDADGVDSDANEQADAKWIQVHTELHNSSPAHDDGTHTFLAYAGGFAWSITPDEQR